MNSRRTRGGSYSSRAGSSPRSRTRSAKRRWIGARHPRLVLACHSLVIRLFLVFWTPSALRARLLKPSSGSSNGPSAGAAACCWRKPASFSAASNSSPQSQAKQRLPTAADVAPQAGLPPAGRPLGRQSRRPGFRKAPPRLRTARLQQAPARRHQIRGRSAFAFSDVRRLLAEAAQHPDFQAFCPLPTQTPKSAFAQLLLRMVARTGQH